MKKRLLSAVLALAMVLTLLPVSAFAAGNTANVGESVQYFATASAAGAQAYAAHGVGWYKGSGTAASPYTVVDEGVSAGSSSNSGKWYNNISDALAAGGSIISLIGTPTGDVWVGRSVTIDLHGQNLTTAINVAGRVQNSAGQYVANSAASLTITDSLAKANGTIGGSLTGNITIGQDQTDWGRDRFALKLENVAQTGKIDVYGGSASVSVENATVSSTVSVYGVPTGTGTTSANGSVTVNGRLATTGAVTVAHATNSSTSATGGSVTVSGGARVNGGVTVTASSGGSVTVKTGATTGGINLTTTTNGLITLGGGGIGDTATVGSVSLYGTSGGRIIASNAYQQAGAYMLLQGYGTNAGITATSCRLGKVRLLGSIDASVTTEKAPFLKATGETSMADLQQGTNTTATPGTEQLIGAYTVDLSGNSKVAGAMSFPYANVTLASSHVGGNTSLGAGTLTLTGSNVTMNAVELGSATLTAGVTLDATKATNANIGAVTDAAANNANNPVTVKIPASTTNYFTSVVLDGSSYAKNTIQGGTFGTAPQDDLLALNLQYCAKLGTKFSYYTGDPEAVNQLVTDYQKVQNVTPAPTGNVVTPIALKGAAPADSATVTLVNSGQPATGGITTPQTLLVITYTKGDKILLPLPSKVDGQTVATWTNKADASDQAAGGGMYSTDGKGDDVTLDITVTNYTVSKLTNVAVLGTTVIAGAKNVSAVLNGNTINISGIYTTTGTVTIPLQLQTDSGKYATVNVGYNTADGRALFMANPTPELLVRTDGGKSLLVQNSNNVKYTLNASGMKPQPVGLETAYPEIVTKVNNSVNGATAEYLAQLGKQMTAVSTSDVSGNAGNIFDFTKSPAINQAIGKVLTGINTNSFSGYITRAQQEAWKSLPANSSVKNPTADQLKTTGYGTVCFVPYLDVQVSYHNNDGTLTATMTPSYRIEIRQSANAAPTGDYKDAFKDNGYTGMGYVAAKGTLGALTGSMGEVTITLPVGANFTGTKSKNVHQDNTYAYDSDTDRGAVKFTPAGTGVPGKIKFTLSHAGTNGLGTIRIDDVEPKVLLDNSNYPELNATPNVTDEALGIVKKGGYDSLQAAVNDVQNLGEITVNPHYDGAMSVQVGGLAKTFYVTANNNKAVTATNSDSVKVVDPTSGRRYTIQLLRDTAVVPGGKSVTISTVAAANGSAGLSASKADPGETITVTTSPKAGYGTSGLTIRTNTGATVAYTSTATNRYTFKVPEGVTSITVTPAFAVNGDVAINVASAANGSASTNASGGKVKGGTTVTVTTRPNSGYTTLAVSAVTNTGSSVSVSRVAENTYTFVAPVNATSVTVTPSFTASAHPFIDVAPSHWANNAVGFVYRHGLMKGAGSSVIFAGTTNISRADLVLILYRLSGEPYASTYSSFNDVAPTAYYAAAVNWANANGIVTGGTGNNFYPKLDISRQDLASILYRYNNYRRGSSSGSSSLAGFVDSGLVSPYALAPMQWAVGNGVVNGSGNSLMPRGTASRYEAAQMLMNYCQRFLNMR